MCDGKLRGFLILYVLIIRQKDFTKKIIEYRCSSRASFANSRFNEYITKEDVCEVLYKYEFRCFYCGTNINKKAWQLDHFNPRANGGLNTLENLVCTCRWCNTMKNALDGNAFINKCFNVVNNNFFKRKNLDLILHDKEVNKRVRKIRKKMDLLSIEHSEELILFIKESFSTFKELNK